MSASTPIEWTDKTWNPTRGCRRVSPGCQHCYAERVAYRFSGEGKPYEGLVRPGKGGPVWTGEGRFIPSALDEPLGWRKPQMVFVNSMSDLFFEAFAAQEIAAVFGVMAVARRHTFQVLTKRPSLAADWFAWLTAQADAAGDTELGVCLTYAANYLAGDAWTRALHAAGLEGDDPLTADPWPLRNVWLVTSVENQATADERIPHLLRCPAAVRGVSYEPALGPVDFSRWLPQLHAAGHALPRHQWRGAGVTACHNCGVSAADPGAKRGCPKPGPAEVAQALGLDWIIAGGESGAGARPCDLAWLRGAVAQARAAGVPVFVKQLGARWALEATAKARTELITVAVKADRKGGDMAEWPADLQVREFPAAVTRG